MLCNTKLLQTCWVPIRGQDSGMWTNQTPRRGLVPVSCPHLVTKLVTQRRVRQNVLGRSSRLLGCLVKVGLFDGGDSMSSNGRPDYGWVDQWQWKAGKTEKFVHFQLTVWLMECKDTRGAISEECGGGCTTVRRIWPVLVWKIKN